MSKIKSLLMVAVTVAAATMASSCFAQGCQSCQSPHQGGSQVFGYPASSVGGAYQSAFSSPACGCGAPAVSPSGCGRQGCSMGGGQFRQEFKARKDHAKMLHDQTYDRNNAWPKPFECADRQLYASIWGPMIDQGFEEQCVLTSAHFDPQTNNLNRFGQNAVAGIMQNMPTHRRTVFINRSSDDQVSEVRRKAVNDTIQTFYGMSGPSNVAFSQKRPVTTHGLKGELIQKQWLGNLPVPAIPVSVGEDVSSAVGN